MGSSIPNFPPVRACIFDMDGLLIDSEDIYTLVTNKILHEYGKPNLPWHIKAQLQGRPGPEAFALLSSWAQLPISNETWLAKQSALQREHFPSSQPLPGVPSLLSTLADSGIRIALATSSHKTNYALKTSHLSSIFSLFPDSQRVLGDDPRIKPGRGKPAPDIYLLALETINATIRAEGKGETEVRLEECLVFEDSVPGVEAGRRAGMRVVWCPHPGLKEEFKGQEPEVLAGRCEERSEKEEEGIGSAERKEGALKGWPSKVGDGWGEQMDSLEGFPYVRYGIEMRANDT